MSIPPAFTIPNQYPTQTQIQMQATFTTVATNTPVDPTTVTITIELPDDVTIVTDQYPGGNIIRTGTGVYLYYYTVIQFGQHQYRWQGLGAVIAASPYRYFSGV